ncbi:hypothetical protein Scep_023606 [Stephania cephalantha]|uniref:C2H2-type domain-containing protein n=1 Tax=Stephania cephalantha TaxID=152367 RepID=A0AAP0EUZ6_9MAGN
MASNFWTSEYNTRLRVPSNTNTTANNNYNRSDQSFDRFSANREALMMRNAALLRQWEKERVREEIMAGEILRRRELELEVWRELAMEREFAHRRWVEALSGFPVVGNGGFNDNGFKGNGFNGGLPDLPAPTQVGDSGKLPFQRPAMPTPTPKLTLPSLGNGHPGKVVFLAKPTSPKISGTKAKSYYIGDKKFIVTGKKKKPKVWGCALCKVSFSSEQALNEHLQENKHLENVAELKANKSSKKQSSSSSLLEKKTDGTTKDKQEAKPLNEDVDNNLFRFWCQDCNLYCSSEMNFASHQKGKKHIARLEALKQNSGNVDCFGTSDDAEKGEGFEMTEKEVMENVGGELPIIKNVEEFLSEIKKVEENSTKVLGPTEALENTFDESVTHEDSNRFLSLELREKQEELGPKDLKKDFLLWCETALASHLKGQKHLADLRARKKVVASFSANHNNGTCNVGEDSTERHEKTVGTMDGEVNVTGEAEMGAQASDTTVKNEPVEATKALGDKTDKAIKTTNSSQVTSLVQEEKKECKLTFDEYKKTFKFWCEGCQIGCPIDAVMDIHLKGKKHIARLKALTQNFAVVDSLGTNDCAAEKTKGPEATKGVENVAGVVQAVKKVEEETVQALNPAEALENRTDESINHVKSIGSLSPNLEEKLEEKQGLEDLKKKFMFWCEDCQLGLDSEGSIVSHLMGKKHMKRLRSRNKVVAADSTSSIHDNSASKTGDGSIGKGVKVLDSTVNNESGEATTLGSKTDRSVETADSSQVPSLEQEENEEKTMIEDLKKKFEFWCEDCQLGLDSEGRIIGHLIGKEHTRRLRSWNEVIAIDSNSSIHDNSTSKTGDGSIGEGIEVLDSTVNNESGEATTLGSKTDEGVETTNSSQVPSLEQELKKEEKMMIEDLKKKFEFWCEDCQIGCHSRVVMDDHLKGKKHARRWLMQCVGVVASASTSTNGSICG